MACKKTRCSLADKAYAESKDNTLERHLLGSLNACHNLASRTLTVAAAVDVLHLDAVQVGNIVYESATIVIVNGLRS